MDVIDSRYPVLEIGNVIIWDLSVFDKAYSIELLTDDAILQPTKKNENYVTFCKCDFNVKSLIYESATVEDVITGWIMANDELELGRLAKWFLKDSLHNLFLTKSLIEEPDIVLVLRLVYWYYRCSLASESFKFKKTEVREKLTRELLKQREKIEKQLNVDDAIKIDTLLSQLETIVSSVVQNKPVNAELKAKSDNYRNEWFKAVWNVTSELLFAGICSENDFKVTFVSQEQQYDYDFIVDGYPAQMKSLNTPYDIQSFVDTKRLRKEFVDTGEIKFESVLRIILDAIHRKFEEVDKALRQGAKIVFLNGTSDISGQFFAQFCLEVGDLFSVKKSLASSIPQV